MTAKRHLNDKSRRGKRKFLKLPFEQGSLPSGIAEETGTFSPAADFDTAILNINLLLIL
jgi:hypothetical protein